MTRSTTGRRRTYRTSESSREELEKQGWGIESYHRAIKQCYGVERSQARRPGAKESPGVGAKAFLRLEAHRLSSGISWYEAKLGIVREAVRAYLACPLYRLSPSA